MGAKAASKPAASTRLSACSGTPGLLLLLVTGWLSGCNGQTVFDDPGITYDETYSALTSRVTIDSPQSPHFSGASESTLLVEGTCGGVADSGALMVSVSLDDTTDLDATTKSVVCNDGSYTASLPVGSLEEQEYTLTARVEASSNRDFATASITLNRDITPPVLRTGGPIISPTGRTVSTGNVIDVTLLFTEQVKFTNLERPSVTLALLDTSSDALRTAMFLSLNENVMRFRYTVDEADVAPRGVRIQSFNRGSAVLADMADNTSSEGNWGVADYLPFKQSDLLIDTKLLTLLTVASNTNSSRTYVEGDTILLVVTANKNLFFNNQNANIIPRLQLQVGARPGLAYYFTIESNRMYFQYTVASGDLDMDGIEVLSLEKNGASLTDQAGVSLNSVLPFATGENSIKLDSVRVDGLVAGISDVSIDKSQYKFGDSIIFFVTFTKPVTVIGDPQLAFGFTQNNLSRRALYQQPVDGGGNATHRFRYGIHSGEQATRIFLATEPTIVLDRDDSIQATSNETNASTNYPSLTHLFAQVDAQVPGVRAITTNKMNGVITSGEQIVFELLLNEPITISGVDVSNPPWLGFTLGNQGFTTTKKAWLRPTRGRVSRIQFAYTLEPGIQDNDGLEFSSTINLAGASFHDAVGNQLNINLGSLGNSLAQVVDSRPATITAINGPASNTYSLDPQRNSLSFTIELDEKVKYQNNGDSVLDLALLLDVSGETKQARYVGAIQADASGYSTTHRFTYNLENNLLDTNGIELRNLWFTGYTGEDKLVDINGITSLPQARPAGAQLPLYGVLVDSVQPVPVSLVFSSPDNSYDAFSLAGTNRITATLKFDENIILRDGNPSLPFRIGTNGDGQARSLSYAGLSGTNGLVFTYSIQASDQDSDGIEPGESDTAFNIILGSAILLDANNNTAVLDLSGISHTASQLRIDNLRPRIQRIVVDLGSQHKTLQLNDQLLVLVELDEPVQFTDDGTNASLQLKLRAKDAAATRLELDLLTDDWSSDSVKINRLRFVTTIPEDLSSAGLELDPSFDTLYNSSGDRFTDSANNQLDLSHASVTPVQFDAVKIDSMKPRVTALAASGGQMHGATHYLNAGDTLELRLTWDKQVSVTGTPRIPLRTSANATVLYADFSGDANPRTISRFIYRVTASDEAPGGIYLGQSSNNMGIHLNGGTINGSNNLAANPDLSQPLDNSDKLPLVIIDNIPPAINANTISFPVGQGKYFGAGSSFRYRLVFNEQIRYQSNPDYSGPVRAQSRIYLGATNYVSAGYDADATANNNSLPFVYAVQQGDDADTYGPIVLEPADLSILGDAITDLAGNPFTTAYSYSLPSNDSPLVFNTIGPRVTSVELPPTSTTFVKDDNINIIVNFNQDISSDVGSLYLNLLVGNNTNPATYRFNRDPSHDTTTSLTFSWTVPIGITDRDGMQLYGQNASSPAAIQREDGAVILDSKGVASDYLLDRVYSLGSLIDSQDPQLTSIDLPPPTSDAYMLGDVLEISLVFDETVDFAGTNRPAPALRLNADTSAELSYESGAATTILTYTWVVPPGMQSNPSLLELIPGELFGNPTSDGVYDRADNRYLSRANWNGLAGELDYSGLIIDSKPPVCNQTSLEGEFTNQGNQGIADDILLLRLHCDEQVSVAPPGGAGSTGSAKIAFALGNDVTTNNRYFVYSASRSSATQPVFAYTIQNQDIDLDGIAVHTHLNTDADIRDLYSQRTVQALETPDNSGDYLVNANAPFIRSITISSDPTDGFITDTLDFVVNFNEEVDISPDGAAMQLVFRLSGKTTSRFARATLDDATSSVRFRYTLENDIYTDQGIVFSPTTKLSSNTQASLVAGAGAGQNASLPANHNFSYLLASGSNLSNAAASVKLSNITPVVGQLKSNFIDQSGDPKTFVQGEVLRMQVVYATPVKLSAIAGPDSIRVPFVVKDNSSTDNQLGVALKHFTLDPSSDLSTDNLTLSFVYVPLVGDVDTNGIQLGDPDNQDNTGGVLLLNGIGLVGREDNNSADLRLNKAGNYASFSHKLPNIDFPQQHVTSVAIVDTDPNEAVMFGPDDVIRLRVHFSAAVSYAATEPPKLNLSLDSGEVAVTPDPATNNLAYIDFPYTVAPGDSAPGGIYTANSALTGQIHDAQYGGTVATKAANDVKFSNAQISSDAVQVTGVALQAACLEANDTMDIVVHFSQPVDVTGTATYRLQLQSATPRTISLAATAANLDQAKTSLHFRYRVAAGDIGSSGIELAALHGNIRDSQGRPVALSGATTSHTTTIGNCPPFITRIEPLDAPADRAYGAHRQLKVRAIFSKPVLYTSSDSDDYTLTLDIDSSQPTNPQAIVARLDSTTDSSAVFVLNTGTDLYDLTDGLELNSHSLSSHTSSPTGPLQAGFASATNALADIRIDSTLPPNLAAASFTRRQGFGLAGDQVVGPAVGPASTSLAITHPTGASASDIAGYKILLFDTSTGSYLSGNAPPVADTSSDSVAHAGADLSVDISINQLAVCHPIVARVYARDAMHNLSANYVQTSVDTTIDGTASVYFNTAAPTIHALGAGGDSSDTVFANLAYAPQIDAPADAVSASDSCGRQVDAARLSYRITYTDAVGTQQTLVDYTALDSYPADGNLGLNLIPLHTYSTWFMATDAHNLTSDVSFDWIAYTKDMPLRYDFSSDYNGATATNLGTGQSIQGTATARNPSAFTLSAKTDTSYGYANTAPDHSAGALFSPSTINRSNLYFDTDTNSQNPGTINNTRLSLASASGANEPGATLYMVFKTPGYNSTSFDASLDGDSNNYQPAWFMASGDYYVPASLPDVSSHGFIGHMGRLGLDSAPFDANNNNRYIYNSGEYKLGTRQIVSYTYSTDAGGVMCRYINDNATSQVCSSSEITLGNEGLSIDKLYFGGLPTSSNGTTSGYTGLLGANAGNMLLEEFLFYSEAHSQVDRQAIQSALRNKWHGLVDLASHSPGFGIDVADLYNQQPASANCANGADSSDDIAFPTVVITGAPTSIRGITPIYHLLVQSIRRGTNTTAHPEFLLGNLRLDGDVSIDATNPRDGTGVFTGLAYSARVNGVTQHYSSSARQKWDGLCHQQGTNEYVYAIYVSDGELTFDQSNDIPPTGITLAGFEKTFENKLAYKHVHSVNHDTRLLTPSTSLHAFSLRRMVKDYSGPLIRVDDGALAGQVDIGFDASGNLDTTALLDYAAANSGSAYVVTWYNQSNNGDNIVSPDAGNRPQIVAANSLYTNNAGKPEMRLDGSDDYLSGSLGTTITGRNLISLLMLSRLDLIKSGGVASTYDNDSSNDHTGGALALVTRTGGGRKLAFSGNGSYMSHTANVNRDGKDHQITSLLSNNEGTLYMDGTGGSDQHTGTDRGNTDLKIDGLRIGVRLIDGLLNKYGKFGLSEWFMYAADRSSNRTMLEKYQSGYWQPTP